jgi:putative tryptophan/tyrosine transport system substrate-binding protein
MAAIGAELAGKCVELVRDLLPSVQRIVALVNASDPFSKPFLRQIQLNGAASATAIDPIMVHSADDLDAAFSQMEKDEAGAVIVQPSLPINRVAQLGIRHRIPAVSFIRDFATEGGLMSYGSDEADAYRRAAVFVDKILKGAKPADLPVEQPIHFELVINLKTAKELGLTIPPLLLARADEVIE